MIDIKKEIKSWIDSCEECEKRYVSNKNYGDALYVRGISYAYERVLKLIEEQEKRKAFSWADVKLGDGVVDKYDRNGKVTELIFTENGFSGMAVIYDGYSIPTYYKDGEYETFKRIGNWVNEE